MDAAMSNAGSMSAATNPLLAALLGGGTAAGAAGAASAAATTTSTSGGEGPPNTNPLPNPWAPGQAAGGGAAAPGEGWFWGTALEGAVLPVCWPRSTGRC